MNESSYESLGFDIVKMVQSIDNKSAKYDYNIINTRESFQQGYYKFIKIRHLPEKFKEQYMTMTGRGWKPAPGEISKYKVPEYTADECKDFDENGYAMIFYQYTPKIEIIIGIYSKNLFNCHGCIYNHRNYTLVINVWTFEKDIFPSKPNLFREFDIIYYDGITGLIDQTKSLRYITYIISDDDTNEMIRIKLSLHQLIGGFCSISQNSCDPKYFTHTKQCPNKLGKGPFRTVENPNEHDSDF